MKTFVVLAVVVACAAAGMIAPASHIVRVPSHDSAIIQKHRFGGNFAYRTDEAHAYATVNPVINYVRRPVGVSVHHGAPIVRNTLVKPAHTTYSTSLHAAPVARVTTAVHAPVAAVTRHVGVAPVGYAAGYAGYGMAHGYGYGMGYGYGHGLYGAGLAHGYLG